MKAWVVHREMTHCVTQAWDSNEATFTIYRGYKQPGWSTLVYFVVPVNLKV